MVFKKYFAALVIAIPLILGMNPIFQQNFDGADHDCSFPKSSTIHGMQLLRTHQDRFD